MARLKPVLLVNNLRHLKLAAAQADAALEQKSQMTQKLHQRPISEIPPDAP